MKKNPNRYAALYISLLVVTLILLFLGARLVPNDPDTAKYFVFFGVLAGCAVGVVHLITYRCPECGRWIGRGFNHKFCPHCGHKLDESA